MLVSALACLTIDEDVAVLIGVPFRYPWVRDLRWTLLARALVAVLLTAVLLTVIGALLFVLAFFVTTSELVDKVIEERHIESVLSALARRRSQQ